MEAHAALALQCCTRERRKLGAQAAWRCAASQPGTTIRTTQHCTARPPTAWRSRCWAASRRCRPRPCRRQTPPRPPAAPAGASPELPPGPRGPLPPPGVAPRAWAAATPGRSLQAGRVVGGGWRRRGWGRCNPKAHACASASCSALSVAAPSLRYYSLPRPPSGPSDPVHHTKYLAPAPPYHPQPPAHAQVLDPCDSQQLPAQPSGTPKRSQAPPTTPTNNHGNSLSNPRLSVLSRTGLPQVLEVPDAPPQRDARLLRHALLVHHAPQPLQAPQGVR